MNPVILFDMFRKLTSKANICANDKEYYGDNLQYVKQDKAEYFTWNTYDESAAYLNVLKVKDFTPGLCVSVANS